MRIITFLFAGIFLFGCGTGSDSAITDIGSAASSDLPGGFDQFSADVRVYREGSSIVIETDDVPDHGSPYFSSTDDRYETPQSGMVVNPNRIAEQDYVFRIPAEPQSASSPAETQLDAIGVALNGVVFFNQYAGRTATGWLPLENEIATFDQYNGHPAQQGNYHYHMEPVALTQEDGASLVGFMLDGYPIYGSSEAGGGLPTDLDACNGHTTATAEYADGTYHYHATASEPYLIGCFRGAAGSVTN